MGCLVELGGLEPLVSSASVLLAGDTLTPRARLAQSTLTPSEQVPALRSEEAVHIHTGRRSSGSHVGRCSLARTLAG
jgi:hypothetical protein